LVIAGISALLTAALALASPTSGTPTADAALDSEEQTFLTLINNYRQQNGLSTLASTPTMETAAEWMSGDMGANDYFSHTDALGRDPWTRLCAFGYCFNTWKGENIAAGTSSAQTAFNLWKDSPGHNANMLGANFNVIGIGRVYTAGSPYGWYWTTDFGGYVPPSSTPTPSPTPAPSATPTPAPTASPSPTPTPAPTASPTPTPAATPAPTPPSISDFDEDGFANTTEFALATNFAADCGNFDTSKPGAPSLNWPADLASGPSANKVDLSDISSFIAPVRRLNTSPGEPGFDARWDISPGSGAFQGTINIQDISALATVAPPMFGGAKAFNGPSCS
jgi:uncharacterized protein YkwD